MTDFPPLATPKPKLHLKHEGGRWYMVDLSANYCREMTDSELDLHIAQVSQCRWVYRTAKIPES